MNVLNNAWDKKCKSYNKFDGNLNEFQLEFFEILDKFGVEFVGKTLVDIGCGTGIYSLYLAGICKNVLGVDSSAGMLAELEKKAQELSIKNIQTTHLDFSEFETSEKFDIAFLTMSPALSSQKEFEKFLNLGNLRIYLNWEKPRYSSALEPFFAKFGKNSWKNITHALKTYLESEKISFETEVLNERRVQKRTIEEAYENILWHLDINELKFSKYEVRKMVEYLSKDGVIEDEIVACMRVLVF